MNRVELTGYVGNDPEIRWTQGNPSYCIANYRMAVRRPRRDKDGVYQTDWITCRVIGKGAEFAEKYVKKGMRMEVTGSIRVDVSEKDGQKRYYTYVLLDEQGFGEKKQDNEQREQDNQTEQDNPTGIAGFDDGELPFV